MGTMNRITQARVDAGISANELAEKLGVDKTTVSNWESGRRQLSLERLVQIAELLSVSVAYLLGESDMSPITEVISASFLPTLHRTPVWLRSKGWSLVNTISGTLVFADKSELSFAAVQEPVFFIPPAFVYGMRGAGKALDVSELLLYERIWVEPISEDNDLSSELRGWYRPHGVKLVENEYGNSFYIDTYGAKWLAFKTSLSNSHDE